MIKAVPAIEALPSDGLPGPQCRVRWCIWTVVRRDGWIKVHLAVRDERLAVPQRTLNARKLDAFFA
ncbi:hypothetical protein D1614_20085 [Maribellus luteus]|uniref:Uncharacterized protein n=1 Tax=Maribellus luteus TaxID=2305463 RepID=A0A399SVD9_9BACT|nr:hypothetical protein D1614_20085 [Maribellus luteus]